MAQHVLSLNWFDASVLASLALQIKATLVSSMVKQLSL